MSTRIPKSIHAIDCPHCAQAFRLPDDVDSEAVIECPHCDADVNVSDLLEQMIPTARIKDTNGKADANSSSFDDSGDYVIPKPLKTAMRRRSRPISEKDQESHRQRSEDRRRRAISKKTSAGEWVRIVIGAFIALPIAQLLLWWAFAMDPFGLAPRVTNFAPILVPPALRDDEFTEKKESPRNMDLPPGQSLHDENKIPEVIGK